VKGKLRARGTGPTVRQCHQNRRRPGEGARWLSPARIHSQGRAGLVQPDARCCPADPVSEEMLYPEKAGGGEEAQVVQESLALLLTPPQVPPSARAYLSTSCCPCRRCCASRSSYQFCPDPVPVVHLPERRCRRGTEAASNFRSSDPRAKTVRINFRRSQSLEADRNASMTWWICFPIMRRGSVRDYIAGEWQGALSIGIPEQHHPRVPRVERGVDAAIGSRGVECGRELRDGCSAKGGGKRRFQAANQVETHRMA